MTGGSHASVGPDGDSLATAAVGTVLAGVGTLVWPELLAGTMSLAVVATFVVWTRAVRALRQRRTTGFPPVRLIPHIALGAIGWSGAVLLGPVFPLVRPLLLGVVAVGFWLLARSAPMSI